MAKSKKKKTLEIPVKIRTQQSIDKKSVKSLQAAIKRGEAPLVVEFRDGQTDVSIEVYPDQVEGKFELTLKGNTLYVDADFRYSWEVDEFGLSLKPPATLYLYFTIDDDAENHYFNDNGIPLDFVLKTLPA